MISLGFELTAVKVILTLQQKELVCTLCLMKLFDVACELSQIMQVKFVVLYRQITQLS